jgi:hypothetical protein
MTQQPSTPKPLPIPQPESDFYWQKCRAHELWLRRCKACARAYFYPRDLCPHCFSRDTEWTKSTGRGVLHSFAIVHRPPTPAFRDAVPYIVALVDLEEGARMPANLVGVEPDPAKLRCDMPVEVVFDDLTDTISLPNFRPAR